MTRYVCPHNGEIVQRCPTCKRTHAHKREEDVRRGQDIPECSLHKIDLVPAPRGK